MASKEVKITIVGDASNVSKAFREASGASDGLDSSLKTTIATAGGFVVGAALTGLKGTLSDAASGAVALEQNAKKAATVFGDSLPTVKSWADESASGLGLTSNQATTLAANMADLLIPMGFTRDEAAKMSTATVGLSGALSEWSGGTKSAAEVTDILTKAYLGETDGLKSLGISISAADIAQQMAADGTDKLTGAAGEQAKALAIQELVMAKSTDAQTAFANGADSTARKQAEATAAMNTAKEQISTALLPAITAGTAAFAAIATVLATSVVPALIGVAQAIGPVMGFIGDHLVPILITVAPLLAGAAVVIGGALVGALVAWTTATWGQVAASLGLNAAMLPWIAALAAVGIAIGGLYLLWTSDFGGIQEKTQAVIDFLSPYISAFMSGIQAVFETVWPIISQVVTTYIGLVRLEIETAVAAIQTVWNVAWPAIQVIVEGVMLAVSAAVTTGMAIVGVITDGLTTINDAFYSILVPVQGIVSDVFTTIQRLVSDLWNNGAVGMIRDGLASAVDAFGGVYDTFYGFGSDLMQGLIDGLSSLWDTFTGWISKITDKLKIDVPGFSPPYDAGYEQGVSFMQGLSTGISDSLPELGDAVGNIGPILGNSIGGLGPVLGSGIGTMPPATNPWDNLVSGPGGQPLEPTPGAPLPAPWEQAPNPLDTLAPKGGAYTGGGNGSGASAYIKTSAGYSELTAAIRQAIKDGVREAMSGAMG